MQAASRPRGPTVPRTSAASSALPSLPLVTLCAPRLAAPENPPLRFFWAALVPGGGAPAGGRGAGGAQRAALVSTVTTPYVRHGKEAYGSNRRYTVKRGYVLRAEGDLCKTRTGHTVGMAIA